MKIRWFSLLMLLALVMPAQAVDDLYGYYGERPVDSLWRLMDRFLDRRDGWHRYRDGLRHPPPNYSVSPWTHQGWGGADSLEGVWLAQSGEYWQLRRGRFTLVRPWGGVTHGEYVREGYFLRLFGPWGEQHFEFRQLGEMMMVQDVHGSFGLLRRVQASQWHW